jgi:hypothetical protein
MQQKSKKTHIGRSTLNQPNLWQANYSKISKKFQIRVLRLP